MNKETFIIKTKIRMLEDMINNYEIDGKICSSYSGIICKDNTKYNGLDCIFSDIKFNETVYCTIDIKECIEIIEKELVRLKSLKVV